MSSKKSTLYNCWLSKNETPYLLIEMPFLFNFIFQLYNKKQSSSKTLLNIHKKNIKVLKKVFIRYLIARFNALTPGKTVKTTR